VGRRECGWCLCEGGELRGVDLGGVRCRILEGPGDGRFWEICAVHERAGGGAGAGVPRVPQAQLHPPPPAHQGEPHLVQHRAQADQSVVSEPEVS